MKFAYKAGDEGTPDPLLQNGVRNDVYPPAASSYSEPRPNSL